MSGIYGVSCDGVRCVGRKRPVPKGIVFRKPTNQGVTHQLKFQRSKRSIAEECGRRKLGGLKVINSYLLNEESTIQMYTLSMRSSWLTGTQKQPENQLDLQPGAQTP